MAEDHRFQVYGSVILGYPKKLLVNNLFHVGLGPNLLFSDDWASLYWGGRLDWGVRFGLPGHGSNALNVESSLIGPQKWEVDVLGEVQFCVFKGKTQNLLLGLQHSYRWLRQDAHWASGTQVFLELD